ncbi:ABC transporter permease [Roseateles toxinivorans]|uniref:Transport permease protein n=1 Tax=Roseateles toxinivorans TaxID=270368 RepID=A0A4R6QHP5_9BURK|nr:ABC transporter permease [Roseateles toxinivorans]TDP62291.1 lipooligosaccharide transport system permease protein [Roseateles toxinivorans]
MLVSAYALPRVSWRFLPVLQRNLLVWIKLAGPSILGNIAEPLITLVAFGYGLGSMIGQIEGLPYILYLASGSIAVSATMAASFEALYSAFSRMQVQKTWESIMNAPVSLDDIVFAEMLWAALKAMFSVAAILVVLFLLNISREPTMLLALPVLGLVGITFASMALVFNALAKGYDFFTYYFTLVLTPMTFLSGVYFPIGQMPEWLQLIAHVLPLTAAVELVRPLIIGHWPAQWLGPMAVLAGYAVVGYYIALVLTRRRFFR